MKEDLEQPGKFGNGKRKRKILKSKITHIFMDALPTIF
jgi:hypothetical protein